ncbi:MAG: transketolase, partial [Bacteroidetes bacterium]
MVRNTQATSTRRGPHRQLDVTTLALLAHTIRGLAMDGVQKANSGHPGMPMGMADVAAVLWGEWLRHNPANPDWFDRDRFVLSGGHGSMLLYSLLHLFGYDLPLEELQRFRQWGSRTPGHPENFVTPGVETTTGPLGQGIANAVGMALAERHLAARFNLPELALVDHYTYVFAGDGDLEEGISHEACSLAGHLRLGKLIVCYDDNRITIDGPTALSFSEDVLLRYEAYGWQVLSADGHDFDKIRHAFRQAHADPSRPTIIAFRTVIGKGSPNKANTHEVHGAPLGEEEVRLAKEALGLPADQPFYVPESIRTQITEEARRKGAQWEAQWRQTVAQYRKAAPDAWAEFAERLKDVIPAAALHIPAPAPGKAIATRAASGQALDHIAAHVPQLMGGSADLTPSNNTFPKGEKAFSAADPTGRYIHYGVREHAMGAIMNGLALHGGIRPYAGTFFVFTDYMRPAIRMAALMRLPVIYVLTHDSIGLGEDGPTHQPVEHLASLRAMPNLTLIRPMDAAETVEAWKVALTHRNGPVGLVLSRQKLPLPDRAAEGMAPAGMLAKGGYVLVDDDGFDTIIIASGSEVALALEAKKLLNAEGYRLRIVSMPSTELFAAQPEAYRNEVLPPHVTRRLAVEA